MDLIILSVLKFAGLAIGLASTMWGMARERILRDDADPKRRASARYVTGALAVGAFLVAATAQGFETLAARAQARNEIIARDVREAREFRNEQRAERTLDLTALTRAEAVARGAEERAALAEARVLSLGHAEQERARDLALARDVNQGTRQNLAQADALRAQTERLLQPVQDVSLTITWEVALGDSFAALAELARSIEAGERGMPIPGLRRAFRSARRTEIEFTRDLLGYPFANGAGLYFTSLARLEACASSDFGFFLNGLPETTPTSLITESADWRSPVGGHDGRRFTYLGREHVLRFTTSIAGNPPVYNSGIFPSVSDMERGSFAFTKGNIGRFYDDCLRLRQRLQPVEVRLMISGRTYEVRALREINARSYTGVLERTFAGSRAPGE